MSSTGAFQVLPEQLVMSPPDAMPTPIAPLITTAMSSTGVSQELPESSSVSDAALMAHAPLASTAMSSSSALTALPSFSEQHLIIH
jgi:hypothetical protein